MPEGDKKRVKASMLKVAVCKEAGKSFYAKGWGGEENLKLDRQSSYCWRRMPWVELLKLDRQSS